MGQEISKERKELYINSAKCLSSLINNIPDIYEQNFYAKQIQEQIKLFANDYYIQNIIDEIEKKVKDGEKAVKDLRSKIDIQEEKARDKLRQERLNHIDNTKSWLSYFFKKFGSKTKDR